MRRRMASIFRTTARRTEGRKCTPAGLKCIIPVDILMYVWAWSKGKIPSETKVRKGGEMVMFVFICPLLGETCAHCFNRTWITIAGDAWADLTLRHVVDSFGSRLILSPSFCFGADTHESSKKTKKQKRNHQPQQKNCAFKECHRFPGLNLCPLSYLLSSKCHICLQ